MITQETYQQRMEKCPQFAYFGVSPKWRGTRDIAGFVHDEVVRQWHNPRVPMDGGVRIEWMLGAWRYAQGQHRPPLVRDVIHLGCLVEPQMNRDGMRTLAVEIGGRACPPWGHVPVLLSSLCAHLGTAPGDAEFGPLAYTIARFNEEVARIRRADDWYLAYEWIHPFCDGNGRTGKILHNWLLGTLDAPVLVRDYFGMGNP